MTKGLHKGIGFLVISLALAGMGATTALAAEPIRIGCAFDLTGPAAMIGDPSDKVARMVVEEQNAAGGIAGRPIELVVYDTASDPTKAVTAVKKLVTTDGVVAVVGPTTTASAMAALKTVEEGETPMIACAGGAPVVIPVKKWVFKTPQADTIAVARLYDSFVKRGVKKVGILTSSSSFGKSGQSALTEQAKALGLTVAGDEKYNDDDVDMSSQLTALRGAGPDAIVAWGTGPACSRIAKNVKQLGIAAPLFLSHGMADPSLLSLAGEAAEGVSMPASRIVVAEALPDSDPAKKLLIEVKGKYTAKYGAFSVHTAYAYDALKILFAAIATAGADRAKVRDAIENTKNFAGADGVFNLSPTDHNGLTRESMVMVTVKKGAFVIAE
jgi:branched-chain amino acid transport system substrate-binding protein